MLLVPAATALSSMQVPAVSTNGQGILTVIEASVQKGGGNVFVDVEPLISLETQQSAKLAAQQAARAANVNPKEFDVFFKIRANTESVDGPSGSHAMALLAYAEFTGRALRSDVTATGSIQVDGSIGRVGGILEKVEAANEAKVALFLLPAGQRIQSGVDLTQYAQSRWNMQVVEARNLTESIALAFTQTGTRVNVPEYVEPPLVVESVTQFLTGVDPLQSLAERQYAKLQESLSAVPDDGVMAQQLRQSINLTRQLLDNGYYYSAANEAFVTKIQADAHALSNASKADVLARISELDGQINAYAFTVPTAENLEWFAGAKLRFYWAKKRLTELREMAVASEQPLSLLEDYAASANWFDAAQQLNEAAARIGGTRRDGSVYRDLAAKRIAQANRTVSESPLDAEAVFHLDAAQDAFADGDFLTASFDASFATAFAEARARLSDAGEGPLEPLLPKKDALSGFSDSAWSQLYFSHALYSAAEANRSDDLSYVVNAIKLDALASELQSNLRALRAEQTGAAPFSPAGTDKPQQVSITVQPAFSNTLAYVGAAGVIVLVVLVALVVAYAKKPEPLSKTQKMDLLEQRLLEGRISERTYRDLSRKFGSGKTGRRR